MKAAEAPALKAARHELRVQRVGPRPAAGGPPRMMRGVLDVSAPFLLIAAADIALGAVLLAVGGAWTGVIAYGLLGLACVPLLIVCAVLISGIASRLGSHHRLSA